MRPSKDRMWLNICKELSTQSTCIRKAVGAVLLDDNGQILSTGWNGVAHDLPHCNEERVSSLLQQKLILGHGVPHYVDNIIKTTTYPNKCAGAHHDSGQGLDICEAIHAEQNALLQCADVQKIHTVYVTVSPCRHCMKLIMNTSAKRVVFLSEYSQSSKDLAEKAGIQWILFAD